MGAVFNKAWWVEKPDEPHPTSGLTKRDIHHIHSTWKPIYGKAQEHGVELHKRFFRAKPELKNFFKNIEGLTEEQLGEDRHFRSQVGRSMSSWNRGIQSLKHPDLIVPKLDKLSEHYEKHNVPTKYFSKQKDIFMDYLKKDMKLSDHHLESWDKFAEFIHPHVHKKRNTSFNFNL